MGKEKIKQREELEELLREISRSRIVTTNGAFDILHAGHLNTFYQAKGWGDVLIVGVNSDASIKAYKDPDRPVNNQNDRALLISALEMVDYVTIFDEPDPRALLDIIKPDYHVKSKTGYKGIEKEVVERYGGQIILLDDVPGYSTTGLLEEHIDRYVKSLHEKYDLGGFEIDT